MEQIDPWVIVCVIGVVGIIVGFLLNIDRGE